MKEILRKLKFNGKIIVINAPYELEREFVQSGCLNSFTTGAKSENTLIFLYNKSEFIDFMNNQIANIVPDSICWIAYPKSSPTIKTDINRDILRSKSEEFGSKVVSIVSINETWSALRLRPINCIGN